MQPSDVVDHAITAADGRILRVRTSGPDRGPALLFHHGTPGSLPSRGLQRAALRRGLRLVVIARPGYSDSDRQAGRSVVDAAADSATVLEALEIDSCLVVGWSGGGPHALASAARLPQVTRVAIVAGLAPSTAPGLDLRAGMDADNAAEWSAAFAGEGALRRFVEPFTAEMTAEPDAALGPSELEIDLARANRDGLRAGVDGWVDDELAFCRDWGFDLAEVATQVDVWHGVDDVNVPIAHGRWLAGALPRVDFHAVEGHDHVSVMAAPLDRVLDGLVAD